MGKEYRFISLQTYSEICPDKIQYLLKGESRFYYSESNRGNFQGDLMNQYICVVNNASCCAGSDSILLEGNRGVKLIYNEYKCIKRIKRITDCRESKVLLVDGAKWHISHYPDVVEYINSGIFLSGTFSFNYYHFTFGILPKLLSCDSVDESVPILVDENVTRYPSFEELLRICNKQKREVIILKDKVRYVVNRLYLVSSSMFIPLNIMRGRTMSSIHTQYDLAVLSTLREMMIKRINCQTEYPRRFFISRASNSTRQLLNEKACFDIIKQFGFQIVSPEQFSLQEQIALFNGAEFIVGSSGAAFTNILYCSKGCKVICLNGYEMSLSLWYTIANLNKVEFYSLFDQSKGMYLKSNTPQELHSSFKIDESQLLNTVKLLLKSSREVI